MTILQNLYSYYSYLVANGVDLPFGYVRGRISYAIMLSTSGEAVHVQLLNSDDNKPMAMMVPGISTGRTSAMKPQFLWDNTSYALGVAADPKKDDQNVVDRNHKAFRDLHLDLLSKSDDRGLMAVRLFLERWNPEQFVYKPFREEMRGTNVVFRLDDSKQRYVHECNDARQIVNDRILYGEGTGSGTGHCLITGAQGPTVRLHSPIKFSGANSSGAHIVSNNIPASNSYNKSRGQNAPVSFLGAFGYATALNYLLQSGKNHVDINGVTNVFWANAGSSDRETADTVEGVAYVIFGSDPPAPSTEDELTAPIKAALETIAMGHLPDSMKLDTPFYVLGLSPNSARLSVRFWHECTIGDFLSCIGSHLRDFQISPLPSWSISRHPTVQEILQETQSRRKFGDRKAAQGKNRAMRSAFMKAILTNSPYPRTLLPIVINRMRADHNPAYRSSRRFRDGKRAAICKACLARDHRLGFEQEGIPMSLDRNETNTAYLLGRWFAVLEYAQHRALKEVNASIRDRYFSAASATPALVFPSLVRKSTHHIRALRGNKKGSAVWIEKSISEIVDGLKEPDLPRQLRIADQGRFVVGYYHQRQELFRPANAPEKPSGADSVQDDYNDEKEN